MSEPRKVQMGNDCAVHRHDEWVPLHVHHVWPTGMDGPDVPSNRVRVCANGHYAIHAFMDHLIKTAGEVPWAVAKHFGPAVRGYAHSGWEQAGRPTTGRSTTEEIIT